MTVVTESTPSARDADPSRWFSPNPSKAWCERYFLLTMPLALAALLVGVIGSGLYIHCERNMYLVISSAMAATAFVPPLLFPGEHDRTLPVHERFWFKANLFHAVFGFVGNYFMTHYFYSVLGARYTFDTYWFNNVPIPCYIATQAYFCLYHAASTVVLRRLTFSLTPRACRIAAFFLVPALCYIAALFETTSIAWFPHYDFPDRRAMYIIGSAFYGMYFLPTFPVLWAMDEDPLLSPEQRREAKGESRSKPQRWTSIEVAAAALASGMLVIFLLDFWRLGFGALHEGQEVAPLAEASGKVPFVQF